MTDQNNTETSSFQDKYIDPFVNSINKSYYDYKDGTIGNKLQNGIRSNALLILIIGIAIAFSIFTMNFMKEPNSFNNLNKDMIVGTILLGFLLLILTIIYLIKYKFKTDYPNIVEEFTFLKSNIKIPIIILVSVFAIFLVFRYGNNYIQNNQSFTTIFFKYFLNFSIIISFIGLFIYYLNIYKEKGLNSENDYQEPKSQEGWGGFFSRNLFNFTILFKNIMLYIPCLLIDFAKYIHHEYKITPSPVYVILLIQIILVSLLYAGPYVANFMLTFLTHDSIDLIEDPINLDVETQFGTFQNLNSDINNEEEIFEVNTTVLYKGQTDTTYSFARIINVNSNNTFKIVIIDDTREIDGVTKSQLKIYKNNVTNHDFSVSTWVFLNEQTGEDKYHNVLDYGSKPKISYNARKSILRFEVLAFYKEDDPNKPTNISDEVIDMGYQLNDNKSTVTRIFEIHAVPLQRWNHIVINFTGTHIDIFMNNELSFTVNDVIPYLSHDNVLVGDSDGIYGGICNTQYFTKYLNKSSISLMYNSLHTMNPPLL
jgi:hypothetical protein